MDADPAALPDDLDTLKAALAAARADVAAARVQHADDQAMIAHLKLEIDKLNRDRYGPRSERAARLLDQLELQLWSAKGDASHRTGDRADWRELGKPQGPPLTGLARG